MTPQRIKEEAEAYAEKENSAYANDYNGYIAGATATYDRAKVLVDALREFISYHETGLLPARHVYEKSVKALEQWEGKEEQYVCPCCKGDGKETCTNPDHGFIDAVGGDTQRLGCPVCGHDPNHKVKNGGKCETCNGIGKVNISQFNEFCNETGYDSEPKII